MLLDILFITVIYFLLTSYCVAMFGIGRSWSQKALVGLIFTWPLFAIKYGIIGIKAAPVYIGQSVVASFRKLVK